MTLPLLILNPILCSPLGFEVLKTFLLTIPEDLNTNRSDCKTFWKKTVGVSGIYKILETVWEC